jgi:hypothetical protein
MSLPDRTLCWVEGPPWDRTCTPAEGEDGAADLLRDLDALRAGLEQLNPAELGRVLGVVLRGLDQRGDSPLPALLRVLADQVDELMADMEQSAQAGDAPS